MNGDIPCELFYKKQVNFDQVHNFSQRVIYFRDDEQLNKFQPRGEDGIFVGVPFHHRAYYVYSPSKQLVIIRRNVQFVNLKSNQLEKDDQKSSQLMDITLWNYDEDPTDHLGEISGDEMSIENQQETENLDHTVEANTNQNASQIRPDKGTQLVMNQSEAREFREMFGDSSITRVGPVRTKKMGKCNRYLCNSVTLPKTFKQANSSEDK